MFNKLSDAQMERLFILAEELGEAQQMVGKVLRHGYDSAHPRTGGVNQDRLEAELGDVMASIEILCNSGDIVSGFVHDYKLAKLDKISNNRYLHHQTRN